MIRIVSGSTDGQQKIIPSQKIDIAATWLAIKTEYPLIIQASQENGNTNAAEYAEYVSCYNRLNDFLNKVPSGILLNMDEISYVDPVEYANVINNYYTSKSALILITNIPPTNQIPINTLQLTANQNGKDDIDIEVSCSYSQGTIKATHVILYQLADIREPQPIEIQSAFTRVNKISESENMTFTFTVPQVSGSTQLHYRFAISAAILGANGFTIHNSGIIDGGENWHDVTVEQPSSGTIYNYWNYNTGEFRAGDGLRYVHAKPDRELMDIGGYKLPASALEGIEEIIESLKQQINDMLLSSVNLGKLSYFFDKTFKSKYLLSDGRPFSPDIYSDFYAYWQSVSLGDPTSPSYCGRDKLLGWPKLPDLRGLFVRGVDETGILDGVPIAGQKQFDAIRNITGRVDSTGAMLYSGTGAFISIASAGYMHNPYSDNGYDGGSCLIDVSRVVPTAKYNRPLSMSLYPFIRVRY